MRLGAESSLILEFDENGKLTQIKSKISKDELILKVEDSEWGKPEKEILIVSKPEGVEEWAKKLIENSPFPLKILHGEKLETPGRMVLFLHGFDRGTAAVRFEVDENKEWKLRINTELLSSKEGLVRTRAGLFYIQGEYKVSSEEDKTEPPERWIKLDARGSLTIYISLLPLKKIVNREAFILLKDVKEEYLEKLPGKRGYVPVIRMPEKLDDLWKWKMSRYLRLVAPLRIYTDDVEKAEEALMEIREAKGLEISDISSLNPKEGAEIESRDELVLLVGPLDDYTRFLASNYAKSFGLKKEDLSLGDNYEKLKEKLDEVIKNLNEIIEKYSMDLHKAIMDQKSREEYEETKKEFEKLLFNEYNSCIQELIKEVSSEEIPRYNNEYITIFSKDPIPIDLHPSLKDKSIGFILSDGAEDLLLSSLLSMERLMSPVPVTLLASPGKERGIPPEKVEKLRRSIKESIEKNIKWLTALELLDDSFDLLPPLLPGLNPDFVVILTHGGKSDKGEGGTLTGYQKKISSEELEKMRIESFSFILAIACESWYSVSHIRTARGIIASRWSVIADSSIELGGNLIEEMSRRGIADLLKDLKKKYYESNSSFFLLGPSALRYEAVELEEGYPYFEYLTYVVLLLRSLAESNIDKRIKRGILYPISKSVWEGVKYLREQSKDIPLIYTIFVEMGNSYDNAGLLPESIISYEEALILNPADEEAWYNMGNSYDNADLLSESIISCEEALILNPAHEKAWNNMGISYGKAGLLPESIISCEEALILNPAREEAWYNMGNSYGKADLLPESIISYEEALILNPAREEAWYNMGNSYGKADLLPESIISYEEALILKPADEKAWNNMGVSYGKADLLPESIISYEEALILKPADEKVWNNVLISAFRCELNPSHILAELYWSFKPQSKLSLMGAILMAIRNDREFLKDFKDLVKDFLRISVEDLEYFSNLLRIFRSMGGELSEICNLLIELMEEHGPLEGRLAEAIRICKDLSER